ncbi:hypothetical protein K470DRAFT_255080 [Piedraia hortae CBS 480.64]|uniref:TAP-C domain-containing protein n=1 Tax=Piedraia hortae CBS 480.64 TaxID=1314780 RepID=A0A6A7C8R9_9PEZI|nr:hypothetical protein K470DRAFT_255080 [Piedraia hortae CBS 480.64]
MVIKVASSDANAFARLDRYQWAGVVVRIARLDAPASSIVQTAAQADAENTKRMLLSVLERRYEFKSKFLDLSALRADEELQKQDIFAKTSTTHKFFPAMMRVLELSFDSKTARDEAVSSVSLANNDLTDVSLVTSLSQTLPKLVNLDLSGNKFENISALGNWRRCFPDLSHLIVTGNPMESKDPEYWKTAMNWWPKLRFLNGLPVRDDQGMSLAVMPYELMAQLSVKTNMVPSYSRLCLEQTNWDLEKALDAFHNVKHTLPGEAFTST